MYYGVKKFTLLLESDRALDIGDGVQKITNPLFVLSTFWVLRKNDSFRPRTMSAFCRADKRMDYREKYHVKVKIIFCVLFYLMFSV